MSPSPDGHEVRVCYSSTVLGLKEALLLVDLAHTFAHFHQCFQVGQDYLNSVVSFKAKIGKLLFSGAAARRDLARQFLDLKMAIDDQLRTSCQPRTFASNCKTAKLQFSAYTHNNRIGQIGNTTLSCRSYQLSSHHGFWSNNRLDPSNIRPRVYFESGITTNAIADVSKLMVAVWSKCARTYELTALLFCEIMPRLMRRPKIKASRWID